MKRFFSATLVFLLCFSALLPLSAFPVLAAAKGAQKAETVTYRSPAIPADAGESVRLTDYGVEFSESLSYEADKITWSSEDLTVTNGAVTPPSKGVYTLKAQAAGRTKTVYLVAKDPADTEYLLYEEDFASGAPYEALGFDTVEKTNDTCTVTVENGKLVLSGQADGDNYIRVLLPEWLGDFANYKIDTVAAMTAAKGGHRWMSVMFRTQNNNYPYYQLAARYYADADNGTELALRTVKDAWDVQYKTPYKERLSDNAYRTFTVEAYDAAIRTSIDGNLLTAATGTNLNAPGRIGFQVRACELSVDKVSVYLCLETPEGTDRYMAEVEDPDSNIILSPSAVASIGTKAELDALSAALASNADAIPATAIFSLGEDLSATLGTTVLSVSEILTLLNKRVIPAFRIEGEATAKSLAALLEEERVVDVFVVSSDANTLKAAREAYTLIRAVLDVTEGDALSEYSDLGGIREAANACGARICFLPEELATKETTDFLQRLLMTVWSACKDSEASRVRAIVSGANGVVTSDFAALTACYTKYFEENTVVRPSAIVGHRGVPSLAPENTVAGSMRSYELGVTTIENDVYLLKDGVVVVMHDKTLDRTTNGTGNVEDYTYEELSKLVVDVDPDFGDEPIPTLEDYFEAFKGLDVQLFVEIKTSNTAICEPIIALIKEYDIADQVNVITFGTAMMTRMKELMPEMSVGYLTGSIIDDENDPTASVERILALLQTYDTTYNPSYNGGGTLGPNLITAASHRGITFWPWTVNDRDLIDRYFFYGTHGITTNYVQYISDCVRRAETAKDSYLIGTDQALDLPVIATTYARETEEKTHGSLVFIEGDDIFTYENGVLTANGIGKASVMLSIACLSPSGNIYYLYTTPFTVESTDQPIETTGETEPTESTTETPICGTAPEPSGCNATVSLPAATILAGTAIIASTALCKRRRK